MNGSVSMAPFCVFCCCCLEKPLQVDSLFYHIVNLFLVSRNFLVELLESLMYTGVLSIKSTSSSFPVCIPLVSVCGLLLQLVFQTQI